ncbi:hypothetical protein HYT02_00485 [Candidatus Gottesmanbacteria bacterium]|nr:hypothetical protein [Candidatus Gottesmanbacteria bacterium]
MFNNTPSYIMHLDLNSCFATVEQQANPLLRGKPIAVAAYTSPGGCILAASIEAKKLGIKTGMRVKEGREIYPKIIVLPPDPNKYRFVNRKLVALLREYSSEVYIKSIDEMVLNFSGSPCFEKGLKNTAVEIKRRIKEEIGEWLTMSVGIAPNRFWAKLASSLKKPDGLIEINYTNAQDKLSKIQLSDIHGIKTGNIARLNLAGIYTPSQFYNSPIPLLKRAFGGIAGYYWYLRLHGFEIDNVEFSRKSYGNSYALYKKTADINELSKILCKLVEKMGRRLRRGGYTAQGIHVSCLLSDYSYWHQGNKTEKAMYTNTELYREALKILKRKPDKEVKILAVSCYLLEKNLYNQLGFFEDEASKRKLSQAVDKINDRYGDFVVSSARMMGLDNKVLDRIAFGGIKELEEFIFEEQVERVEFV